MEIQEVLQSFINEKCPCGKSHQILMPKIIVKSGAIYQLPSVIAEYHAKKIYILADLITYTIAGKKICEIFDSVGIDYNLHVFKEKRLEPNEYAVGSAMMHYTSDCDLILVVGSGVLNDLGKIVATLTKKPFVIVGTSFMDGYASSLSAVIRDGFKVSLPTKYAEVIIGDTDILKNTPIRMMQAGIGDMLAKYISITDWRISHEVTGEYYCERVADLVRKTVKLCVEHAEGLLQRNEESVKVVFEAIMLCALSTSFSGLSRPVSGTEHNFSHFFDMRALEFGTKMDMHGIQCAIGTLYATKFYYKTLSIQPNKEKALSFVRSFDFNKWSEQLRGFLGQVAESMISLEGKERKYDIIEHEKRLDIILRKWDKLREIICKEIPPVEDIEKFLDLIGIPKTIEEIGVECDIELAFKATKDMRKKYMLSMLLWDLGELDDLHM